MNRFTRRSPSAGYTAERTAHLQIAASGLGLPAELDFHIWFTVWSYLDTFLSLPCVFVHVRSQHHSNSSYSCSCHHSFCECFTADATNRPQLVWWLFFCLFFKWTVHRVGHTRNCFENCFKHYLTSIYHHILLRLCPSLFTLVGVQWVQDDLEASVDACTVITLQACSLSRSDASLFAVLFCINFL